jgi:hypothetical protein
MVYIAISSTFHLDFVRQRVKMRPFIVSWPPNESVIQKPTIKGFRTGLDLALEHGQEPDMSAALFQQCVMIVLIPFIDELRTKDEFPRKPGVLFMDNCPIHMRLVSGRSRTKQLLQALDLGLFGVLKKKR